jgi:hypothetical protein
VTEKKNVAQNAVKQCRDIPEILRRGRNVRDTVRDTLSLIDEIDQKLPVHLHYVVTESKREQARSNRE